MSKRLVHSLEGLVIAMFKDMAPTYRRASDWERDKERSLHELEVRGERMFTKDFPAIRKHFDKCLDEGQYSFSGAYLTARSGKVKVPAFLRDLYLQVFDVDGKLLHHPSPNAVADIRQFLCILDKLKTTCEERYINEEVDNFLLNEKELRDPILNWNGDNLYLDYHDDHHVSFVDACVDDRSDNQLSLFEPRKTLSRNNATDLQRVCDIISVTFGDLHLEREGEYAEMPKHGKGRVSDLAKTESKFRFSTWPLKLDRIFPYDRYAVPDLSWNLYLNDLLSKIDRKEHSSKLIAVPKTQLGPRLIASEPSYHQWIQQLIRNQLEQRIKATPLKHCVSFGDQMPNRVMAKIGSFDGRYTTVDLKSASDRLSCWAVERAFRQNITILERIHASRTRVIRNAINDSFDSIVLKKCFTQGSACTFPVQTVVYSMLCIASVIITDNRRVSSKSIESAARQVRVFGDDLIIPSRALEKLSEILELLQLKINPNKTFSKGRFRESCGFDSYAGVNVTPARIRRLSDRPSHEVAQSMLESSNNLFKRGMWNTANWLSSFLKGLEIPIEGLPHDCDLDDPSTKGGHYLSFSGSSLSHLQKRWNKNLHRYEVRAHRLVSKSKKTPTHSACDLMDYLSTSKPRRTSLSFLDPVMGSVGVTDKSSSVMRRGWIPVFDL